MNAPASLAMLTARFATFARLAGAKFLLLPPLMLVAGLFEGVGIMLFLPVLEQLATGVGDRGINRSVGQRQRIAIARELYRDPQILIFDEATSALDAEAEDVIRQHLERLVGQRTIVLIAHRLSTIRHADYLYVIDRGRVVEEGTFDAFSRNPRSQFHAMRELQRVVAAV